MPSKKIAHADGLSKLIPDNPELLEETVIASLKEKELSEILVNTIRELLVILEDVIYKHVVARKIRLTRRFSFFHLLNK